MRDAYTRAVAFWEGGPGWKAMEGFARAACEAVGWDAAAESLGPSHGTALLADLRARGLSAKTVGVYYGAFRRMLRLAGISTEGWPKAPAPPRRTREAISHEDIERVLGWLDERGFGETADLGRLLAATGMRIAVEALTGDHLEYRVGDAYDVLAIRGKGGHERLVPVVDRAVRDLLADGGRMGAVRSLSARTHRWRWGRAVKALRVASKLPSPHAVRHSYASEVYKASGNNLVLVQSLLGHADPKTTARYLHIDLDGASRVVPQTAAPKEGD